MKYISGQVLKEFANNQAKNFENVDSNGNPINDKILSDDECTLSNLDKVINNFDKYDKINYGPIGEDDEFIFSFCVKEKEK